MANRDITVRIKAEIGAFKRDMAAAADAAKKTADATEKAGQTAKSGIGKLAQTAQTHEKAWGQVSTGMVASGTAIVGALALTGKAAMDWQSQWTGVTKTVDGTPAQLAEVEGGLRNLAKTLPSTHAEIAGVAEAAGQLGVARDDITGFTKTMIDLGETTNLTAEDAATNIAQISNVMGTMEREGSKGVERFGSALVALGNDGASTEADILSMAQRIAGAGASLNASEADVLALSNTLASMGVRSELGGGVATRVLLKMRTAVDEGGESLESFADVAGTSAEEFATKFSSSPMEALQLVAEGIARTNAEGGNLTATLKDMGIKGTEEMQVMLALANSGDLLTESLELGAKAWEENTALAEEAGKRYETAESKVKIAWNNIKDAAIDAGAVILPVVAGIAEVVADLAGGFADLPGPVQTALVVLGGLAGTAALLGGALMKIVPNIQSTVGGMRALGDAMGMTNRNASKVPGGLVTIDAAMSRTEKRAKTLASTAAKAGQAVLMLAMVGPTVGSMVSSGDVAQLDSLNASLLNTSTVGTKLDEAFTGKGNWFDGLDVGGLEEAFRVIGNPSFAEKADQNISKILTFGSRSSSDFEFVKKNFEQLDGALAGMAKSGNAEAAAESYEVIAEKAEAAGVPVEKLAEIFPQYAAALQLAAAEGGNADFSEIAADLEATGMSAESAAEKIDDFYAAMVNAGMVVLGEREALRGMQEAFDAAGAAAAENGKNLDTTTEKGRANQAALDGIASATLRAMEAQREAGASTAELGATISEGREAFIENAVAMGMSEKAAGALADQLNLIPGAVYVQFDSNTDDLAGKLMEIHELVQSTPDGKVTIEENSPAVTAALEALGYIVTTLPDGRIQVSETGTDATGKKIDATAGKKRTSKINAEAITGAAETALNHTSRDRTSRVTQTVSIKRQISESVKQIDNGPITGRFGRANGGSVFGPGTETSDSIPAWLSTNEHVLSAREVRGLGGHGSVERLRAMARNGQAPAFATGGAVGRAEKRVKDLQKSYSAIDSKKANRARKQAAKDRLDAAKEELKASKAQAKLSADARKAEREKQQRLSEARFDLRRDLKRGDIRESFMSGSGMSVVDRLFEQSSNKDLSKGKRSSLRSLAYSSESQLLRLEKRSESLTKRLDAAVKRRDELLSVKNQTRDQVLGSFDLGSLSGQKDKYGYQKHVGKKGLLSYGKSLASGAKKLHSKVQKLQKLGFNDNMIQQVIDEWTQSGTFEVADAMLSMNKGERSQFNKSFDLLSDYGYKTGHRLVESMSEGGVYAARGLVNGLESEQDKVDDAFYKLGKSAEKAFKRSLGIKSPSRVMMAAGVNVGEGAELGILSKIGDVQSAADQLMTPPALMVPPSFEVSRHAQAQAMPAVAFDYDKLAAAMANVQVVSPVNIDKNTAARVVQVGSRQASRLQ